MKGTYSLKFLLIVISIGGYPMWPYQILGILCVTFAFFLFLIGAAVPRVFEGADLPYLKAKEMQEQAAQGKSLDDPSDAVVNETESDDTVKKEDDVVVVDSNGSEDKEYYA